MTAMTPFAVQAEGMEKADTVKVEKEAEKEVVKKKDAGYRKAIEQKRIDMLNLDKEIMILKQEIDGLNEDLKIEKDLVVKQEELKEKEAALKERWRQFSQTLKSWQLEGTPEDNFIDFILDSESFADMVSKTFVYKTLLKADKTQVENLEKETVKLKEEKKTLEAALASLKVKKTESVKKEKELAKKKATMKKELEKLEEKEVKRLKEEIRKQEERKKQLLAQQLKVKKIKADALKLEALKAQALKDNPVEGSLKELRTLTKEMDLGIEYQSAFIRPAEGRLTSPYGWRNNPMGGNGVEFHEGIDIANPIGTPILSTADGVVVKALASHTGYGHYVTVKHDVEGDTFYSVYAHLSIIGVEVGETVKQGEIVGLMGSTGRSTGPHLHFEIQDSKKNPLNPESLIDNSVIAVEKAKTEKKDKKTPITKKQKEVKVKGEKVDKPKDEKEKEVKVEQEAKEKTEKDTEAVPKR